MTPDDVISYWFGELVQSTPETGRFDLWFEGGEEVDREIRERFLDVFEAACSGRLDGWAEDPRSLVALIVVLDQFPRNMFRGAARAFDCGEKAKDMAELGLARGFDRELPLFARIFFYLPFEHSEDLEDQEQSLELFHTLKEEAPPELKETFDMVYDYAVRHHEIIKRFGRFPHRNAQLGRESTPEELEFLKEPNSSF